MHGAVVAAECRVQVDQELDVEARYLPLQDVGDGLPLVFLVLPLPPADVGPPGEQKRGSEGARRSGVERRGGAYVMGGSWMALMAGAKVRYREWLKTGERMLAMTASSSGWHRYCCLVGTGGGGGVG